MLLSCPDLMVWAAPTQRHRDVPMWSGFDRMTREAVDDEGYDDRVGYRKAGVPGSWQIKGSDPFFPVLCVGMPALSHVEIRDDARVLLDQGEAQLGLAAHQIKGVRPLLSRNENSAQSIT